MKSNNAIATLNEVSNGFTSSAPPVVPGLQMHVNDRTISSNNCNGNLSNYVHQNVPLSAHVPDKL